MNPNFSSAQDGFALTPSDTVTYSPPLSGVYVGGTGDVAVVFPSGASVVFKAVPVGTTLPISPSIVKATLTTATLLIGLR